MSLELKHLSPYFPYSLKGKCIYTDCDEIEDLQGIDISKSRPISTTHDDWYFNEWKPILRPLSDLTKEIEYNGEKFVPMDYFTGEDRYLVYNAIFHHKDFTYLPYNLVQLLFKWHFDLNGLIEKGLAVDINTLNQEK